MDILKAVQTYISKMISEAPGMKVLLLDSHTVRRPSPNLRDMSSLPVDSYSLSGDDPNRTPFPRDLPHRPNRQVRTYPPPPANPLIAFASTTREPLNHLSCIAFLSPTDQSIEWVKQELTKPRYGGDWICGALGHPYTEVELMRPRPDFSNTLSKSQIEEMAAVDEFEVVKEVQVGAGNGR